jgi:hypothetical protein
MRCDTRIPLFVLLCLGLGSLAMPAMPAQRQGQILDRQEATPRTVDALNATQGMQTPVLGFVSSAEGGELRAIVGIPGASALGGPLAVPAGVSSVYLAPRQNYALLAPTAGESIGLMTFAGADEGAVIPVCAAISQPDIVAFSPTGAAAALYSKAEERLQVITGLPDSPQLARVIAQSDLPDEVRFLAVADDGVTLLEGTVHSAVYLLPQAGSPRFLHSAKDLEGMAFAPRTDDVVVFDREADTVFELQEVNAAGSYLPLADGLTGLGGIVFLETSSASAVIASTSSNDLRVINLQSLQVQSIHLPGTPKMLQPLRTSGDYLLFYRSGLPAWILDSNGREAVVSLVPARPVPRIHPRLVPISTAGGSPGDPNEQPGLAGQPGFGAGCSGVREPSSGPKPLPRPAY